MTATTLAPWEPAWATEVVCPRLEVTPERRTTACPVAADEERVFVVEERDDAPGGGPVSTVVALGARDGREEWAVALPGGARTVLRYPSLLVVRGPRDTHGVDPETGTVRWTHPGFPVAPLGRDHVLLDHLVPEGASERSTMTVVDAETGGATFSRSGPAEGLYVNPCGEAGLVVVSEGGRLTAHAVLDGAERWSVESAVHHHRFDPIVCGDRLAVAVEGGELVARDVSSGAVAGRVPALPVADDGIARRLEVVDGTVVLAAADRIEGYAAAPTLSILWSLDAAGGGRDLVVAPVAGGVAVATPGDRAAWFGPDGTPGPQLPFPGPVEVVIEGDRLVAWGAEEVLVASAAELTRARRLPLPDVRRAAATPTHVVVTTRDEVRLYPFDP
ncbi:PQQ-binding-like beta-propeller repeat protein [Iamia sp. SCSIO 61187]|uniref:outer membrane protein assembly factor BamB family protein n=1 Tax=Iamia sp. SCSIO 61187 TaxID=2722752 RepID=UPI001C637B72|nr:PQQ-binding-like beta-propeller repeat protein [Iamia sp. SCSIO 61187]QYG95026.1 PQQ-binding-like beta-propeller repeat protein [Iamia sp. SCSIO 61187]